MLLQNTKKNNNEINAKRKFSQERIQQEITSREKVISGLINKNSLLEVECFKLEEMIFRKRREQMKKLGRRKNGRSDG